jgi:SepF-like predicted cell division protein (DUF552 family)
MIISTNPTIQIREFTVREVDAYFNIFGEEGWLDVENFVIIDVKDLKKHDPDRLNHLGRHFKRKFDDFDWVILDLNNLIEETA